MAISHKCLSAFILFITFAASYALAPVSPAQDSSIQQPPASLPGSSNLIAPGTSNINPVLQAALGSSDPLAFLRNATQGQLGRPVLHCNGAEYGYNLPFASCIRALTLIPDTTQKLSFGPRTRRQFNFGTPYRLLSSKSTDTRSSLQI